MKSSAILRVGTHRTPPGKRGRGKTERNFAAECKKGDAVGRNQLIRAEEERKRQATVQGSCHGLMCPMAPRRLKE